ncbi:hypothetical protein NDA16_003567 [Ustilago loliicola]|nr:hypothetical protein NDA16_003567 [Ustilago loliicola]
MIHSPATQPRLAVLPPHQLPAQHIYIDPNDPSNNPNSGSHGQQPGSFVLGSTFYHHPELNALVSNHLIDASADALDGASGTGHAFLSTIFSNRDGGNDDDSDADEPGAHGADGAVAVPRPKITSEFVSLNEDLVPASLDMHGDMLPADQHPSYPFGNLFGPLGGMIAADSAIVGGANGAHGAASGSGALGAGLGDSAGAALGFDFGGGLDGLINLGHWMELPPPDDEEEERGSQDETLHVEPDGIGWSTAKRMFINEERDRLLPEVASRAVDGPVGEAETEAGEMSFATEISGSTSHQTDLNALRQNGQQEDVQDSDSKQQYLDQDGGEVDEEEDGSWQYGSEDAEMQQALLAQYGTTGGGGSDAQVYDEDDDVQVDDEDAGLDGEEEQEQEEEEAAVEDEEDEDVGSFGENEEEAL